jgi:2-iminobutanoate/2-iminopropanoate deaminase
MVTQVNTVQAPEAIGPYSQAIRAGDFVFCSGQLPLDPTSGQPVDGDIGEQTERALRNMAAVLNAADSGLASVVRTTVYLVDISDFNGMNVAYAAAFGNHRPARVTVEVSRLPKDVRIQIECVAATESR